MELEVFKSPGKGLGVRTKQKIPRGEMVCTYTGDLIDKQTALAREEFYTDRCDIHCYLYFFKWGKEIYCIDATDDETGIAKFINHSRKKPNLIPKLTTIVGRPIVAFFSSRTIKAGEELVYDYGERRPSVLEQFPWLKK